MEGFISAVLFSLPGLLAYFWIQMFGVNPVVKHNPTEMIGISALLWVPTASLTLIIYNLIYWLCDSFFYILGLDLSGFGLKLLQLTDIKETLSLSTNTYFLIIFLLITVISSYAVALIWSKHLYSKFLNKINKVRISRNLSKLSKSTSVWDSFFMETSNHEEESLIVEIYKIDKPDEKLYGSVTKMSRPYEAERSFVLNHSEGWKSANSHYNYPIKRTYFDTKSGIIVNELDTSLTDNLNPDHEEHEPIS